MALKIFILLILINEGFLGGAESQKVSSSKWKIFLIQERFKKKVRIQLRSVGGEQRIDLKTVKKMMMEMKQREDRLPPEFGWKYQEAITMSNTEDIKSLLIKREDKLLKRCPPKQIIRAETTSVSFTNVFRT